MKFEHIKGKRALPDVKVALERLEKFELSTNQQFIAKVQSLNMAKLNASVVQSGGVYVGPIRKKVVLG